METGNLLHDFILFVVCGVAFKFLLLDIQDFFGKNKSSDAKDSID